MRIDGPMLRMLRDAQHRVRLHMPGHKGRLPLEWMDSALDTTEIAPTDDLFSPCSGIARAQELYAAACGAAQTIFLSGGSTSGMLAMLLYAAAPDGKVIMPRTAHHSAISASVWGGLEPVFVAPRLTRDGALYYTTDDVLSAMERTPDARAVLITRPDYYGVCGALEPIARRCRRTGMLLCVDEAHGAHWPWQETPQSAGRLGADLWIQSAHKTLPTLTGGAVLHAAAGIDTGRLLRTLRMVHTSSPSFLILQTLDGARAMMDAQGSALLSEMRDRILAFWKTVKAAGYRDAHDAWAADGLECDPSRIVVDCAARRLTGWQAQEALTALGIDAEMADDRRLVFIPSIMDEAEWLEQAALALAQIPSGNAVFTDAPSLVAMPERAMCLREAALRPQEKVALHRAAGRIAAVSAGLYPPGVPLVTPGEVVGQETVDALEQAPPRWRFGLAGENLFCVRADRI